MIKTTTVFQKTKFEILMIMTKARYQVCDEISKKTLTKVVEKMLKSVNMAMKKQIS